MKKTNMKMKPETYTVRFWLKNKQTGEVDEVDEQVYSFGTDDFKKVEKEIENKYRGKGFKIRILKITHEGKSSVDKDSDLPT
jgi:hypothetical protein